MNVSMDVSAVQMAAVCGSKAPPEISSILRKDDGGRLEVEFNACTSYPVPYNFIRDSCPSSFDSRTGLRTFSISEMTGGLKVEDVGIIRGNGINKLRVEWVDGQVTELDSAWLYAKCISDRSDRGLDEVEQPPTRLWGSDLSKTLPTFEYKDLCSDSFKQFKLMQSLVFKEGVVLIQSAPNRASLLTQVCNRILRGAGDLHLNLTAIKAGGGADAGGSLGSSSTAAETGWRGRPIHSERTYCEGELGFVALMCTKQPEKGGELILVDGYNLENRVREEVPEHHSTLCSALVLYSFVDHSLEFRAERTVFALDRNGKVQTVAFDEQHRMRWEGGPRSGGRFLDAWCSVANMAYRPELVSSHVLRAGDVLVIDARRVLWGQAPWKGGASACGIEKEYVERNQVLSRYRSLRSSEQDAQLSENPSQSHAPRTRGNGEQSDLNTSTRSDLKLDLSAASLRLGVVDED